MSTDKMFHMGDKPAFNIWHNWACVPARANIPKEGKINFVNGRPAPNNQRTIAYSSLIEHPDDPNNFIWNFGDFPKPNLEQYSISEVKALGWLQDYEL